MRLTQVLIMHLILLQIQACSQSSEDTNRGEVSTYKDKFIWTGTNEPFVPNYIMLGVLSKDLSNISEQKLDRFIEEFIHGHGFTGIHFVVAGQWFHIGDPVVTVKDSIPDPKTLQKIAMIIHKTYIAGGSVHFWVWGDDQRSQTSKSTDGGIMGKQERFLMDEIADKLGPLKGWTMSYGFDLFEWVNSDQLTRWHDYMWAKPGWNHLLGARSNKNQLNQISESMDYSSYEWHKPSYDELVTMTSKRTKKPSFSEDRYRIRHPSKYPEKDYNEEETRRGLWYHTMAGGVAAIWGNLDGDGIYKNKEELKCFSVFWNDHHRFRKEMEVANYLTNGYCLKSGSTSYVFYKESTAELEYRFYGASKDVIAIDTKKGYEEISLGRKKSGKYIFYAPYESDWAIAIEKK
ncbi:MAG: hypothetical protein CMJ19_08140 [Phycisphaeraceae bacterium]|nr:hypothetical protein [Phycisphaeraceae bacterium]